LTDYKKAHTQTEKLCARKVPMLLQTKSLPEVSIHSYRVMRGDLRRHFQHLSAALRIPSHHLGATNIHQILT